MDAVNIKAAGVAGAAAETCTIYAALGARPSIANMIAIQAVILVAVVGLLWASARDEARRISPRIVIATLLLLLAAWILQVNREFWHEWMPLRIAIWSATTYLLSVFLAIVLPAVPAWTQRSGVVIVCSSVLCVSWSVFELAFRIHY